MNGSRKEHFIFVCRSGSHLVARRWSRLIQGVREGQVETAVQKKKNTHTQKPDSMSTLSSRDQQAVEFSSGSLVSSNPHVQANDLRCVKRWQITNALDMCSAFLGRSGARRGACEGCRGLFPLAL